MTKSQARGLLDNWQFWVGVAYFGLAAVTVALWVNFSRVDKQQQRTAIVFAEHRADVISQYEQCVKSIPILVHFNRFVGGVQQEHATLLGNAILSHAVTPPGSAFYRQQAANIVRLRQAKRDVQLQRFPVPSRRECLVRRNRSLGQIGPRPGQ